MRVVVSLLLLTGAACHARPDFALPVQQEWRLVEERRFDFGDSAVVGDARITDVAFDPTGRTYLIARGMADGTVSPVLLFGRDGKVVRRIGVSGTGRGALGNPTGIVTGPDGSLWINDAPGMKIVRFDSGGTLLQEYPRTTFGGIGGWQARVDSSGVLHEMIPAPGAGMAWSDSMVLHRLDPATGRQDTSAVFQCERPDEVFRMTWSVPAGESERLVPYAPVPRQHVDLRGIVWCADGRDYWIEARRLTGGDSVATVGRSDLPVIPVSEAERDRFVRTVTLQNKRPLASRELRRIPERQPAISSLRTDEEGNLWVARPEESGHAVDVWSRAGLPLAVVKGPEHLVTLTQTWFHDGGVYGVVHVEGGRPVLVRYRIVKE